MRAIPAIFTLMAAVLLLGCSDNSCLDNASALPLAQFRISGTSDKAIVTPVTVYGVGAPGDSLLADSANISEIILPLRATVNTTQYRISLGDIADTLTLNYRPVPRFVNAECGAMYHFRLTQATTTTHALDSVAIALHDSTVTHVKQVALYLYLTPP